MKIRKGFVSNSSSSSFICDICGEVATGYDAGLSDVEFVECVNGHTYCESHDTYGGCSSHGRSEIPTELCPVCQLTNIPDNYMLKYLFMQVGKTREQLTEEIKAHFGDFNAFAKYVDSKYV